MSELKTASGCTIAFDEAHVFAEIDPEGLLWISVQNDDASDMAILDPTQRLALARALIGSDEVIVKRKERLVNTPILNTAQEKTIKLEIAALMSLLKDPLEEEDERQATINIIATSAANLIEIANDLRDE